MVDSISNDKENSSQKKPAKARLTRILFFITGSVFLGLGIISPIKLLFFILILIASTSIVHLFRKLLRKEGPYAYYPVLLITFVFSMFFMGLY